MAKALLKEELSTDFMVWLSLIGTVLSVNSERPSFQGLIFYAPGAVDHWAWNRIGIRLDGRVHFFDRRFETALIQGRLGLLFRCHGHFRCGGPAPELYSTLHGIPQCLYRQEPLSGAL